MDVCARVFKCAGVLLFLCGCLQAVTITPLPYRGNEPGYRLPRGRATFLDQEEGNRIRREMMAGFYGGSNYGNNQNHDGDSRYFGNEIDADVYYGSRSRNYYPNYSPDGGSSNRWAQDCYPRGEPYGNNGISSYDLSRSGYINHDRNGGNRHGVYTRNRGRGFEEHNRGYQPRYDTNRSGSVNAWGRRSYYGGTDKDDNVGEGTVGFYGRSRRQ